MQELKRCTSSSIAVFPKLYNVWVKRMPAVCGLTSIGTIGPSALKFPSVQKWIQSGNLYNTFLNKNLLDSTALERENVDGIWSQLLVPTTGQRCGYCGGPNVKHVIFQPIFLELQGALHSLALELITFAQTSMHPGHFNNMHLLAMLTPALSSEIPCIFMILLSINTFVKHRY